MSFFEFPHTRTYDSDLGWLIKKMGELIQEYGSIDAWKSQHELEYKDLANKVNGLINSLIDVIVPWDAGIAYRVFSIVEYQGTNYIALQDVPVGIMIDNTDYWQPANTVLQQINAISLAVENLQEYNTVVADYAELLASTADRVLVLEDNSYFGSNCPVVFEKIETGLRDCIVRNDGSYMIPVVSNDIVTPNAPISEIGNTVASYVSNEDLVFGNYSLFTDEVDGEIDCSSFVQAVIRGITYENSKYNGLSKNILGNYCGSNVGRNPGAPNGSIRTEAYYSWQMGLFYAEQNRLFKLDYTKEHPAEDLAPGDILFESDFTGDVLEDAPLRPYGIHHMVVVIAVKPEDDEIIAAQAGDSHAGNGYNMIQGYPNKRNACRMSIMTIKNFPTRHVYYARPEYAEVPTQVGRNLIKYVTGTPQTITAAGASVSIAQLGITFKPDTKRMYTLILEGDLPDKTYGEDSTIQLNVSLDGNNQYIASYNRIPAHGKMLLPFVPPNCDALSNIRVWITSGANFLGSHTYTLKKAAIVEGVVNSCSDGMEEIAFTPSTNVTVTYCRLSKTDREILMAARFTLPDGFTGNSVVIGQYDTSAFPATGEPFVYGRRGADPVVAVLGSNGNITVLFSGSSTDSNVFLRGYVEI